MKFDFDRGEFTDLYHDPDRRALTASDRTLSWRELEREAGRIAAELSRHCAGDRPVMIVGNKEAGMVTALLACLMTRTPYVPIGAVIPDARIGRIAEIAGVDTAVLAGTRVIEGLRTITIPSLAVAGAPAPRPPFIGAADLAYVIFTSGSTGEPKGVQINRRNVNDLAQWVASGDFRFTADDVVMNQCAFSFDVSFFDLMAALQAGGHLVLNTPEDLKAADPYGRLAGTPPTVWSSTPSFLSLALLAPTFDQAHLPKLTRFYVAGEAVHGGLAQRLWRKFPDAELWNAYGPTEATVITTLTRVDRAMISKYMSVPIGRVKPNVTMPTTAPDGAAEGELYIVGPNVSPGYLNRPDLNATKFSDRDGQRAYLTGDLGYHRDGLIFYLGRVDSQIKLHGFRIELEEIDNCAATTAGVESAATVGLRRGGEVKKLVCFLKVRAGETGVIDRVKAEMTAKLPYYMVPAEFREVDEMPQNVNQKVDRLALAKLIEGGPA